jgi:hemolysin activation/secretion protein
VNLNNPAGLGDVATLRALTSGPGLTYARAAYQVPLGRATVGVAYSWLSYELGEEFTFAQATGTARIASVFGSYPLIRSRNTRLYAGLALDAKTFQDKRPLNLDMPVEDKKAQVLMASLRGEHRDQLGGGGVTGFSLTWSSGHIDLQTPGLKLADAPVQSNGHFNKLSVQASRLQSLTRTVSVYAGVNGQLASKNLDVSEKMALGGMYGVRAYPEGEAYGDEGYMATLEARVQLPTPTRLPGRLQLIGFVDTGSVTINKNPWTNAVPNSRSLHGAGVGLNWANTDDFSVRAYYARKLGNEPATSAPDRSGRFWIQAVKAF